MSTTVDLHQLANLHGFGKAKAILRETGNWDEHAADGDEYRQYTVYLVAEYTARTSVQVKARSTAEAKELATEKAKERSMSDWELDIDFIEAETVIPASQPEN